MKIDIEVAKKMRSAGKTYKQIADEFGATPPAVYQLLTKAEPKKGEPDYEEMVNGIKEKYDPEDKIEEIDYDEIDGKVDKMEGANNAPPQKKAPSKSNKVCCPQCDNELDEDLICHDCGVLWKEEKDE